MERVNLNSNEKFAREIVGLEADAKHFTMNGQSAEKLLEIEASTKFNQQVDEYVEKLDEHVSNIENYKKCIEDKMDGLEIMPILNYLLVKPFKENPFQRIRTSKSGLIVDTGGAPIQYKNTDNGEFEEEENFIHVAVVIEAGKECKYVKEGDIIMYTKVSEVPIPFYKQGLAQVNETRVMVVINEKLKERFNG